MVEKYFSCMSGCQVEKISTDEGDHMVQRKANHIRPGMNNAAGQGKGAGYNEEFSNEPLTEAQKQNNKKRKKTNN